MTPRFNALPRSIVFWAGNIFPSDLEQEFLSRDLVLEPFIEGNWGSQCRRGKGIIFLVEPRKLGALARFRNQEALNYSRAGFLIHILTSDEATVADARGLIQESRFNDGVSIEITSFRDVTYPVSLIAQKFAKHDAGRAPNPNLDIDPIPASEQESLLLSRVFSDFDAITVTNQDPGYASPKVLMVNAMKAGVAGPYQPLPFFVKFGSASEICNEYTQFRINVEGQVPVANRPALLDERSWWDDNGEGLLVSSFIDGPEPLLKAAHRRNVHKPVHLVFEEALRCWIDNGLQNDPVTENLYVSAGTAVPAVEKMPAARADSAKMAFGATMPYSDLVDLMKRLPLISHRRSTVHGDLHSKNVIVQGDHPVLIDFADINKGPASSDASNLEVSLVFHGYEVEPELHVNQKTGWLSYVESAFTFEALGRPIGTNSNRYPMPTVQSGIRGIRLHGLSLCLNPWLEYPTMVAFQLLRFASHQSDHPKGDATARDIAYALAEKILIKVEAAS